MAPGRVGTGASVMLAPAAGLGHLAGMSGHPAAAIPTHPGRAAAPLAHARGPGAPLGLARHINRLALLLLAPALALGSFTAFDLASRLRAGMEAGFTAAAAGGAQAVADQVETRAVLLGALAASPLIGGGAVADEAFRLHARRALAERGPWIALAGPEAPGETRLHTREESETMPPLPEAELGHVLRDGVANLSRYALPGPASEPCLLLAVPVLREGRAVAALATPVTQPELVRALARAAPAPGGFMLLLDPEGAVVAAHGLPGGRIAWTAPPRLRETLAQGTATGPMVLPGPGGAAAVLFGAPLPFAGWAVVAGQEQASFSAAWTGPAMLQWAGGLAVVALGLLLAAHFARRMLAALAAIRAARPGVPRVAEFEALGAAIAAAEDALRLAAARAERVAAMNTQLARTSEDDRLLLESVVHSVPEPIFVKDRDLRYVMINDAAARSLGWHARDCIGRTAAEMTRPEVVERFDSQDRAVLAAGRTMEFDDQIVLERGKTRWYRTIKAPWRDGAGRVLGVVGVARDVTRRRAAEEKLRAAEAAMRRIARADSLTVMSLGIAHELNQPLTAASNFLHASLRWLDRPGTDPGRLAAARAAIEEASAETLRAAEILRHIRDFIDRGQTDRMTLELGPLLADTVALMRAARAEEGLPVEVDVPETGFAVMGDRVQLQQVFVNLLRNAIEATEGQAERGLCVSLVAEGGVARILLADRGPGLPPEVTERMFEPFVSTRAEGMGIGLSIARTIVESHGGRITARARAGGGTEFVLDLPLHRVPA